MEKPGRNAPCPCGSGKKFKNCCAHLDGERPIGVRPSDGEISHAFQIAFEHHQAGRLTQAEAIYQQILQVMPKHPDVLHLLGLIAHQSGRLELAAELIRKSIALAPKIVEAHFNLGLVLQDQAKLPEAVSSYRKALSLNPNYAEAHFNLGNALKDQGKLAEAVASYQRAVSLTPDDPEAHFVLANALKDQGRTDEAVASYQQALALDPTNGSVRHLIAALTGSHSDSPPQDYIEKVFDGFAKNFEISLKEVLQYKSPEILVGLIAEFKTSTTEKWDILDLGCGTGLVGSVISPHAKQLVGVDLSANMLDKAKERNLYHRLEKSDLLSMMKGEPVSSYDVIVATDVFIYIGRLNEIVEEGMRLLRPGGIFAFSVEALESIPGEETGAGHKEYRLNPTGRYAHSSAYLDALARENGFKVCSLTRDEIRIENDKMTYGWYALFEKPVSAA